MICFVNQIRKKHIKHSQFVGELFNNMINQNTEKNVSLFENSKFEDLKTLCEDLLICVCKLIMTIYKQTQNNIIKTYCSRLITIQKNKDLPKRLQFKIMDVNEVVLA